MPNWWDWFGRSGPHPKRHRNLQEGLFQIASQTCSLLVQVNNTNNITFGDNATNINCTNVHTGNGTSAGSLASLALDEIAAGLHQDREQLLVLIPPANKNRYKPGSTLRKPRLSTVLEGPPLSNDEENDLWNNGYVLPADHDGSPVRRWGNKRAWCRPSCIPISIILILIFLVVLLPLLDHASEKALQLLNMESGDKCQNTCSVSLVESIPDGLIYPNSSVSNPSTYQTWMDLIENAQQTIEIGSFYWTLRQDDVYKDPTSKEGQDVFDALLKAGTKRNIKIKIAQNAPTSDKPNEDTELLEKVGAAEVRSLNFHRLLGGGVLHTKMWIIDRKHFYIGSANMDWRALTQVKEMGVSALNCSCMAEDIGKIFDVYWELGKKDALIPPRWPDELSTLVNAETPMNISFGSDWFQAYVSSSPPPMSPVGRTDDADAILRVIRRAEKFVYISVMDYFPLMIYTPKVKYWSVIDDALRTAAVNDGIEIRMLISRWNHSRTSEDYFLKSLADLTDSYPKVQINIRRFVVPADEEQQKIPFARVNHNKYMVSDNAAYVGTSNWSGDYFTNTAGVAFVVYDPVRSENSSQAIRAQLQAVFERDWYSNYSQPLKI